MRALILALLISLCPWCAANQGAAAVCAPYRAIVAAEASLMFGLNAPVPMLTGQLYQESACRAHITAWDKGRGVAQFMDATAAQITKIYPELGAPDPYNPHWAIRAQVYYLDWLYKRAQGNDPCQRWAAVLKMYNAGPGYVQRAQRKSAHPGQWFGETENINAGQSAVNFEFSRQYPRRILFNHQPHFKDWGPLTCKDVKP